MFRYFSTFFARPAKPHLSLGIPLFKIQATFIPGNIASHLIRLSTAWWMISNNAWGAFALFVAATTSAQIAARLLLGGLGDFFHPLKLGAIWAGTSTVAAIGLSLLVFMDSSPLDPLLLFAGCLLAIGQGAREPLAASILPKIAAAETVSVFVPLRTAINTSAQIGGPLLAGVAVATIGVGMTLVLGAALFGVGAVASVRLLHVCALLMKEHCELKRVNCKTYVQIIKFPITSLQGYLSIPSERGMAAICFCINFALPAFFSLLIPTIVREQDLSPSAIGMFDAAFGIGVLIGSLFVVKKTVLVFGRVLTMTLGVTLCGLSIGVTTLWPSIYAVPVLVCGGVGLIMLNINIMTVRAISTPKTHIGGFCSSASFLTSLAIPLGNWVIAAAMLQYGYVAVGVAISMLIVSCGGLIAFIPGWRSMSRLTPQELKDYYVRRYPAAFRSNVAPHR